MTSRRSETFEALREAVRRDDLSVVERLLADDVRWYGTGPGGCYSREQVLAKLRAQLELGARPLLEDVRGHGDRAVIQVALSSEADDVEHKSRIWLALTVDGEGRIAELQDYSSRTAVDRDLALRARGPAAVGAESPRAPTTGLVPFVQVADVARSIDFYRLLGLEVREIHEHEERLVWASMAHESAAIMLSQVEAGIDPSHQGVLFYLYSHDLRALRDHLVAHGITPGEIVDGSPGPRREMRVGDPDGYCLMVAEVDDDTIGH